MDPVGHQPGPLPGQLPHFSKWRKDHYPSEAKEAVENRKIWKSKLETSEEARRNYFNKVGFRLVDYWKLAGIDVPPSHGNRRTTQWLRTVLDALKKKHGDAEKLSKGQKSSWTKLLNHNRRDVVQLHELLEIILRQYEGRRSRR